jgi:hypothetical protein
MAVAAGVAVAVQWLQYILSFESFLRGPKNMITGSTETPRSFLSLFAHHVSKNSLLTCLSDFFPLNDDNRFARLSFHMVND